MPREIVSVPCRHKGGPAESCPVCKGTGEVRVSVGFDGKPKPCSHRGGELRNCTTCKGSGWAGLVE